jgi:toxin ParE1/3/4
MTPRFHVLPAADRDLDDQADYLAREASIETALRFYDAADTTFAKLAEMPNIGAPRQSAKARLAGIRFWRIEGFENHLIFYRPIEGGIEIIRVLHAARDIESILADQ